MTVTAVREQEREKIAAAAVEYADHGWGVLPGSIWDGTRYTLGHSPVVVDGLVPVMASGRTLRTAREVRSWWSVAPYAVLARTGEDVDVLTAPAELTSEALELPGSPIGTCPVMRAPNGESARLLIRPGSRLWWRLRTLPGVTLLPAGVVVALPPTQTAEGTWSWWIHPADCDYRPGLAGGVQKALGVASRRIPDANRGDES